MNFYAFNLKLFRLVSFQFFGADREGDSPCYLRDFFFSRRRVSEPFGFMSIFFFLWFFLLKKSKKKNLAKFYYFSA